jgi:hypothetical protein
MSHQEQCEEIRDDLIPFIEGRLDDPACHRIRAHLDSCADCTRAWDDTRETLGLLDRHIPVLALSDEIHERLLTRARADRLSSSLRYRTEVKIAAGFVLLLGVVCFIWLILINDQIVQALHESLTSFGISLPWLTEGVIAPFLAPLLFVLLCSLMTLIVSPLLLKKKKEWLQAPGQAKEKEAMESQGS